MAEEALPTNEAPELEAPQAEPGVEAPASPAAAAAPQGQAPGGTLGALGLVAVALTVLGFFGQLQDEPSHLPLGLGLVLWGALDLLSQRRGLAAWKGKQSVGNSVNLGRAIGLLAIGAWVSAMGVGLLPMQNSAVVVTMLVSLAAIYLGVALGLDAFVKGLRLSPQAFLLAALAFMFLSYLYFAMPFIFGWSAAFALIASVMAAWSAYAGALEQNPPLGRAVLLAVLLLGLPQGVYTVQQMFFADEQPLFTPTLLIPRMRQVVGGLSPGVADITWAPVHTQKGQPGDVPFSDKLAFTGLRDGKPGIGLFLQDEKGPGRLAWVETDQRAGILGFSQDGAKLAVNLAGSEGAASLAMLESGGQGASEAYVLKTLVKGPVEPGPGHGQLWRHLGKQLYYAAPAGGPREQASSILRVDFKAAEIRRLLSKRSYPAASPDGASLLSVGFFPNERQFLIADGADGGSNERVFEQGRERRLFPAWNLAQSQVLFMKGGRLKLMNANGTNIRDFSPDEPVSKVWLTDKTRPFTLQWKETGDRFRVYRSSADGSDEKLIYETWGDSISAPIWSPDGQRVAFMVRHGDSSSIYTVGSQGEWPRRFFVTKDAIRELKFSPDSLRLGWLCDRKAGGEQEAWTAGVEGLDPKRAYLSKGALSSLTWSPVGKHIAFEEAKGWKLFGLRLIRPDLHTVIMVDLALDKAKVMTRYGIASRQPAFSPQGVAIAYVTDEKPWSLFGRRRQSLVLSQLY